VRGRRKLRKIDEMCTAEQHVYDCDSCLWMLRVSPEVNEIEIHRSFDAHNCKHNSLKRRPVRIQRDERLCLFSDALLTRIANDRP
jgi:hypothetical protein